MTERGAAFKHLLAVDAQLVRAGHHPLTAWWQAKLRGYYESGARSFIGRVGRGGAKSHTSAKVALTETLFGEWNVPPGERHFWAFVSLSKEEAVQRLLLLQSFLRALKVEFDVQGDTIALRDMPRGFRVFAAQVGAVSGFRCYGYSADELAKWTSGSDYANPADEVCASLNAMTVTHPGARRLLISSPFGLEDYHAHAMDRGTTAEQYVAAAPTWVANPSVTEASTHQSEPDARIWAREYAAIPSAAVSVAFEPEEVLAAFKRQPTGRLNSQGWLAIDPSSLRGDGFGFVAGGTTDADELVVQGAGEFDATTPLREIVASLARGARALSTSVIYSDQREEAALRVLFDEHGIELRTYTWGEKSKEEAVLILNRWLHEGRVSVVAGQDDGSARLRDELLKVKARLTLQGRTYYSTNGLDVASCLVTLAHAANAGEFKFGGSNPLFEALAKQAQARTMGPGTTRSTYGALPFHGVDYDALARHRAGWA